MTFLAENRRLSTLADIRHQTAPATGQASDWVSIVFIPRVPGLWLLRAASRRQAKEGPDLVRLPSLSCYVLRCPTARAHAGAFRLDRSCSLGGGGEESSPAPSVMW